MGNTISGAGPRPALPAPGAGGAAAGAAAVPAGGSSGTSASVYVNSCNLPCARPAAGGGGGAGRTNASQLKARMAQPQLQNPQGQQQAFDALKAYQTGTHRLDTARAVAGEVAEGATLAAITFGVGRSLGNIAADHLVSEPGEVPVGTYATGDAALHALGSATGGAPMNMLGQVLAPMVGAMVGLGHKLTPVPASVLVPQRLDDAGQPIPLTRQEEALRANIQARQKAITYPGSVANIAAGTGTFTGAQLVRVALEAGLLRLGTQQAEQLADGDVPSTSTGEEFVKLGYNTAVSAAGGAGLSALIATQKLNATVTVPDITGGPEAPSVKLPLFAPQSSVPSPTSPPWGGTASEKLSSLVARFGNLFVAGVSIQAGLAAQKYLTVPDLGKLATVGGQMMGVLSYFAGVGKIVANEAARKAQAAAAQAPQALAAEAAPADAEAGAAVSVELARASSGGAAGAALDPAGARPVPTGNPLAASAEGAAGAAQRPSNPFAA
jgi:hypothetical protein